MAMRITALRVENFRSIKALDIELGETTVFIGPNDDGIEAQRNSGIRILRRPVVSSRAAAMLQQDVKAPGCWRCVMLRRRTNRCRPKAGP
jgi:putative ATP-dependent endonuclease of OLD family